MQKYQLGQTEKQELSRNSDLTQAIQSLFGTFDFFTTDRLDGLVSSLECYLSELSLWNPKLGLVETLEDVIPRHILDSLAPLPFFSHVLNFLKLRIQDNNSKSQIGIGDLGSGAGLPGLLLSLVFPEYRWDLVESSGRRISFLENVRVLLPGANVRVVPKSFEQLPPETYDLITNRAFQPLEPKSFSQQTRLLVPGGYALWYKGRLDSLEGESRSLGLPLHTCSAEPSNLVHQISSDYLLNIPYSVPGVDAQRHLVLWKKPE